MLPELIPRATSLSWVTFRSTVVNGGHHFHALKEKYPTHFHHEKIFKRHNCWGGKYINILGDATSALSEFLSVYQSSLDIRYLPYANLLDISASGAMAKSAFCLTALGRSGHGHWVYHVTMN
jgi:hypothetical protein